jgi:hypothetical protein
MYLRNNHAGGDKKLTNQINADKSVNYVMGNIQAQDEGL